MGRDDKAEFENVFIKSETEKAVLCIIDGEERWVPKSCVHEDSECWKKGDEGTLILKEWFALKEGLL